MKPEEELQALREELQAVREENHMLKALVAELLPLREQVEQLKEHVKQLETRLAKDSRTSSKPPSSDGLGRQPRRGRRAPPHAGPACHRLAGARTSGRSRLLSELSTDHVGKLSPRDEGSGTIWPAGASPGSVSASGATASGGSDLRSARGDLRCSDLGRHAAALGRRGGRTVGPNGRTHR